jgi:hypothetical protein
MKGDHMKDEKQLVSEAMSFCSPLASLMAAEGTVPIGQFQFDTVMDVENQEKENLFQKNTSDKETIDTGSTDFQPSLGVLIESDEHSPYETADERFEEVPIDSIQPFGIIPDYIAPTDLKYPVVVMTPSGYVCLDGWNLIEDAKANGKMVVKCYVECISEHCDEELAIRKVSLREKPRGGISSYAETVRNTKYLKEILSASNKDLKVFHHGGSRKGESFTSSKQENVTKVLSFRLGKSISTIGQYLNHGLYLNDETLNFLAEKKADKDFFEKAQIHKRTEINAKKSQRVSDDEITTQISGKMVDWYGEHKVAGKITPVWNEIETDTETGSGRRGISTVSRNPRVTKSDGPQALAIDDVIDGDVEPLEETIKTEASEESILDPWQGNKVEDQEDLDSLEKVKGDIEELAQRLLAAVTLDDPDLFWERIVEEMTCLSRISLRAAFFRKEGQQ